MASQDDLKLFSRPCACVLCSTDWNGCLLISASGFASLFFFRLVSAPWRLRFCPAPERQKVTRTQRERESGVPVAKPRSHEVSVPATGARVDAAYLTNTTGSSPNERGSVRVKQGSHWVDGRKHELGSTTVINLLLDPLWTYQKIYFNACCSLARSKLQACGINCPNTGRLLSLTGICSSQSAPSRLGALDWGWGRLLSLRIRGRPRFKSEHRVFNTDRGR